MATSTITPQPVANRKKFACKTRAMFGRMLIIDFGELRRLSEIRTQSQIGRAGAVLRALLREAVELRGSADPAAPARRNAIFTEIFGYELPAIKLRVKLAGYRQSGSAWVSAEDVDDVAHDACVRVINMFERFEGTEPAQFYAAVNTCVRYAVADYIRADKANRDQPVDPGAFDPGSHADEPCAFAEGAAIAGAMAAAAAAAAGPNERAEAVETLATITKLEPRAADVVALRMSGHSSAEIAEQLGLTVANVDQIFSRNIRKLRELMER